LEVTRKFPVKKKISTNVIMGRKQKPLKKMSTRRIALKTHRQVQKMESDEETKWHDITFDVNGAGAHLIASRSQS